MLDHYTTPGESIEIRDNQTIYSLLTDRLARTGADTVIAAKKIGPGRWQNVTTGEFHERVVSAAKGLIALGIAKGDAADLLRAQREKEGVTSATLDLGGDVFVMGRKTDGSDWRIAVKDPADTESYLGVVSAADKFIVTSGVYERYFEENGVRYHHILDPKTGCPAESGLVSVTVLCENGAWADALSTACFVLGPAGALALRDDLADQGTDFELILATDDGRVLYTDGLADAFTPNDESGYTYEALA